MKLNQVIAKMNLKIKEFSSFKNAGISHELKRHLLEHLEPDSSKLNLHGIAVKVRLKNYTPEQRREHKYGLGIGKTFIKNIYNTFNKGLTHETATLEQKNKVAEVIKQFILH